jgi:hypothetical protein
MSQPSRTESGESSRTNYADGVEVVPRGDFIREFGSTYVQGQHVTFLGPTQRGKTTLCHELLSEVISTDHRCVILAGKPPGRDHTMASAAERMNLRIVETWPPLKNPRDRNRNGFVLRPHHTMRNLDADEANLRDQFGKAMRGNYASTKPVITVVDEAHHVQNDLKLKREFEAPLMRGAPVNAQWSLIQRGRYMSYLAYDAPEHLFIFYDPDRSNVRRYSEMIGGVDPGYVTELVVNLKTYRAKTGGTISEALYIRRAGPYLCIVDVS